MTGFALSFFAGLSLGMLGGGGSILTVPILVYYFKIPASKATSYSLFTVGTTGLFGAAWHIHKRLVDWKIGTLFLVLSMIGVTLARRIILPATPDIILSEPFILTRNQLIMLFFAVVMSFAGRSMIFRSTKASTDRSEEISLSKITLLALGSGVLMGLLGAGGGFIIVPVLVLFGNFPMKRAIGTSLFIISMSALNGFVQDYFQWHAVDWTFLLPFAGSSVAGVIAGLMLSRHVSPTKLKAAFGWLLLFVASGILVKELLLH